MLKEVKRFWYLCICCSLAKDKVIPNYEKASNYCYLIDWEKLARRNKGQLVSLKFMFTGAPRNQEFGA